MDLVTALPELFLPPVLPIVLVSDFSGFLAVISEKSYQSMKRLEGVYGLYFLSAISYKDSK
jgi:hypothetical protein